MLVAALTLTGCDFMRKMTGRPTSEEVEQMKAEIERVELLKQEEARLRAVIDSLTAVQQVALDSAACAADSAAVDTVQIEVVEQVAVQKAEPKVVYADNYAYLTPHLENRFYIIIGAFQTYANAKALMDKAAMFGYSPVLIGCKDGLIGVGVCPVDEYEDALRALQILRREEFCPKDSWIYTNRRRR